MSTHKTIVGNIDSEVLRFTVGRDPVLDAALTEVDCIGSAAHVTMLSRLSINPPLFNPEQCRRVIAELIEIMRQARTGGFKIRPADQDVHMAVERVLTGKLGAAGKKIHTARSRNDQVAVDMRLYAKEQLLSAILEMSDLAKTTFRLGRKYAAWPMVGRTHLQPAMPSSVGLWISAYGESLLDDFVLIKSAYEINNLCPLGSAAGYGVPLKIDRALTARLLGFAAPIHNVLHASNARGKCEAAILSALSQVMLTLSRLAEDIILYSMPEFGYFSLPATHCTGSSIMPQKRNPDVLELIRARTARVLANAATAATIVSGLPGGYNRDLQEVKELIMDGVETTRASLRIINSLLENITVNRKALQAGFRPEVFATDRALELVVSGTPFRDAYDQVKSNLDQLEGMDAKRALADRNHAGAAGGLDFAGLNRRAGAMRQFAGKERRHYYKCIAKLLGVNYPALDQRAGAPGAGSRGNNARG